MFWIFITVVLWAVIAVAFFVGKSVFSSASKEFEAKIEAAKRDTNRFGPSVGSVEEDRDNFLNNVKAFRFGVMGVAFFLWSVATLFATVHQVDEGHVGLVYEFGAIVDQTGDGLQVVLPWQSVKQANIQVQKETFEGISAASSETQDVTFTVSLNYQVSPNAVQSLYSNVGSDYFSRLVTARLNTYFKDETVNYNAVDVTRNRDEIRDAVKERLGSELDQYSISVVDLLIDNIEYSPEFNQSIEDKQVASQNALREQERVKQSEYEAQQRIVAAEGDAQADIARAMGDAEAVRLRAEGQAEANRLLTESLSPIVVQWEAVQSLGDNVEIALIPSGDGILIDPAALIGTSQEGN